MLSGMYGRDGDIPYSQVPEKIGGPETIRTSDLCLRRAIVALRKLAAILGFPPFLASRDIAENRLIGVLSVPKMCHTLQADGSIDGRIGPSIGLVCPTRLLSPS